MFVQMQVTHHRMDSADTFLYGEEEEIKDDDIGKVSSALSSVVDECIREGTGAIFVNDAGNSVWVGPNLLRNCSVEIMVSE